MTMSHLGTLKEADGVLRAIRLKKLKVREIGVLGETTTMATLPASWPARV